MPLDSDRLSPEEIIQIVSVSEAAQQPPDDAWIEDAVALLRAIRAGGTTDMILRGVPVLHRVTCVPRSHDPEDGEIFFYHLDQRARAILRRAARSRGGIEIDTPPRNRYDDYTLKEAHTRTNL